MRYTTLDLRCAWKNVASRLEEFINVNVVWMNILDYWCGNGHLWDWFLKKWANVDFAEISTSMLKLLNDKYGNSEKLLKALGNDMWNARVFEVNSPMDLPVKDENYDYIVVWSVFHHIDPNNWKEYLDNFLKLLKKGWRIIITWWDETDIVLQEDWYKWHVTWEPSYTINNIIDYIDNENCDVEETWVYDEKLPIFDIPRIFRYYIVRRK